MRLYVSIIKFCRKCRKQCEHQVIKFYTDCYLVREVIRCQECDLTKRREIWAMMLTQSYMRWFKVFVRLASRPSSTNTRIFLKAKGWLLIWKFVCGAEKLNAQKESKMTKTKHIETSKTVLFCKECMTLAKFVRFVFQMSSGTKAVFYLCETCLSKLLSPKA